MANPMGLLLPGSPASSAAAKRAAIIERYGLGRVPPIPIPTIEQIKADGLFKVGACHRLCPSVPH